MEGYQPESQRVCSVYEIWELLAARTGAWDAVSLRIGLGSIFLLDLLFSAFQIPGCVKEIKPTKITLNSGLRYHLVNADTGLG